MKPIFLFLTVLFSLAVHGQSPNILWQKSIGGNKGDYLEVIRQTADHGYIAAGFSASPYSGDKTDNDNGIYDCWIVRFDGAGNKIWDKTIGGDLFDGVYDIQEQQDGSFWLAAQSASSLSFDKTDTCRGGMDYWILHLDANGNLLSQRTLGSIKNDYLQTVLPTSDGGLILSGYTMEYSVSGEKTDSNCMFLSTNWKPSEDTSRTRDLWVIKIRSNGYIDWQRTYGGYQHETIGKMIESDHGTYILAGTTSSDVSYYAGCERFDQFYGYTDYWVLEIDGSNGALIEEANFGGYFEDNLSSIARTNDGGYILIGTSESSASGNKSDSPYSNFDYWVVKLNANLVKQWDRVYGSNDFDQGVCVQQTADGNYLLGGWSEGGATGNKTVPNYGGKDYWILKVDGIGDPIWQYSIGGNTFDRFSYLEETWDEKIIVGGTSISPVSGLKNQALKGDMDFWILLLDKNPLQSPNTIRDLLDQSVAVVYPIPAQTALHIQLQKPLQQGIATIYDMLGNRVTSMPLTDMHTTLDIGSFASGQYILRLTDQGQLKDARMINVVK